MRASTIRNKTIDYLLSLDRRPCWPARQAPEVSGCEDHAQSTMACAWRSVRSNYIGANQSGMSCRGYHDQHSHNQNKGQVNVKCSLRPNIKMSTDQTTISIPQAYESYENMAHCILFPWRQQPNKAFTNATQYNAITPAIGQKDIVIR